jgi:hypothetical protein
VHGGANALSALHCAFTAWKQAQPVHPGDRRGPREQEAMSLWLGMRAHNPSTGKGKGKPLSECSPKLSSTASYWYVSEVSQRRARSEAISHALT